MYWSDVVILKKIHELAVVAIKPPSVFAYAVIGSAILFNMPVACIEPLNIIAQIIKRIVFIIPNIPLDFNRLLLLASFILNILFIWSLIEEKLTARTLLSGEL